jgi:uncharacterized membrane protein
MRFGKCLLAGLLVVAAAFVTLPVFALIGLAIHNLINPSPGGIAIGWNPVSLIKQPSISLIIFVIACFLAGFLWESRRQARTGK